MALPLNKALKGKTLTDLQTLVQKYGSKRQAAFAIGVQDSTFKNVMSRLEKAAIPPTFDPISLPSKLPTLEQLIARRCEESERNINADDARELIPVNVKIAGPYGLFLQGDPHVDDSGCDFRLLKHDVDLVKGHPHIVCGGIGDLSNNWIGRLARLYGEQSTSARESWLLVEWLVNALPWLFIIGGNHDLWSGAGDPIKWMMGCAPGVYEPHGIRLALKQPCGTVTRLHARHDFPGHSIWNNMHGPKRESIAGFRDHIIVCGHRHTGGDEGTVTPDGIVAQLVRVSGYKKADSYAAQLGLKKHPIHSSALVIIDPRESEKSRGRVFCAPTIDKGIIYLNALRAEFDRKGRRK